MASTKNSYTAATTKSGDLQEPNQRGHCGRCCCPSSRASCSGRLLLLGGSRSRNNNNSRRCSNVVEQPTATLIAALSILLLSLLADDGVAFRHQPSLPLLGRVARIANYRISRSPFQKSATSSTSLRYKNSSDGDLPNSQKRKRRLRPSKKKYKASRKQRVVRSYQLHKKGVPVSKEELVHHVQSVFSDLREFEREFEGEEEADAEPCILPEPDEDGSQQRQQQLDNCRKLDRHPALVLNADYQPLRMLPLSIWSWQDTVKAVLSGKAVVVDIYPDVFVRAVSLDMPVPSVIALLEYAPVGKTRPAFTRRNVFLRDGYRCQYCSELYRTSDLSLDHVEPRCFGGQLTWDNTVTCCRKCNGRKGCLRPSEIHQVGMELRMKPRCPSLFELASEATKFVPRKVHPTWAPFLGLQAVPEEK